MKRPIIAALTPLCLSLPLITTAPCLAEAPRLSPIAQASNPIRQTAQAITVKVLVANTNGSGVIIGKTGQTYRIVTNAHVVSRGESYKIQTPDGKVYTAKLLAKGASLSGTDLAVLTFQSPVNYTVATLGNSASLQINDAVYSAGFPIEQEGLVFVNGKVTTVTEQALKGGYQVGYSGDTYQGMSGGPLLNGAGELIGIVGMGKGSALLEAYTYEDESRVSGEVIDQWRRMSFAVPIAKLGQIGDQPKVAEGSDKPGVPVARNYTGIVKKVDDIAQQVTVRIDGPDGSNGSGTIVGKEGNVYYVLTACHVPVLLQPCKSENLGDNLVITTPDGERYVVKSGKSEVTILNEAIDVAIIKFTAAKSYPVATLGKYTPQENQWLLLSGFPAKDKSKQRHLTAGTVNSKEQGAFYVRNEYSQENGQELVYRNSSARGMSGGGVFDTEGRLVGVHSGAEDELLSNEKGNEEISLGYSLGVPVTAVLGFAEAAKFSTASFPTVSEPAPKINDTDIQQITAQLFRFQVPTKDSTIADWMNYGNALWRAQEATEAVRAFDQVIIRLEKEGSKDTLAQAYYAKGLALINLRSSLTDHQKARAKTEEALTAFKKATAIFPNFPEAWRLQGRSLKRLGQDSEAVIAYESAILKNIKFFAAYVELAAVLVELKRYPEALKYYAQAIQLNRTHPWAYLGRGILYYDMGEKDKALQDFNQAITINPQDADAYNSRGILYKDIGEKDKALQDYTEAININPQYAYAYNNRGRLYKDMGEKDKALEDYDKAININSEYATAYLLRGNLYENMGEKDKALLDYSQAININSEYAEAYLFRGNLYENTGEKDKALQDYSQAIDINPQFALAYFFRGILYADIGEKDKALLDYNQAIIIDPQFAGAYNNRGGLYKDMGEKDKALLDFNQAIKIDPQYAYAYNNRGGLYKDMGEKDKALQDYTEAIIINPQYADAYFSRGILYLVQKKRDLALADFKMVISIDKNDIPSIINIGLIKYEMGATDEAMHQFEQAIDLDPKLAEPQLALATVLYQKGQLDKAKQLAQSALKIDDQFATVAYLEKNAWGEKLIQDTQQMIKTLKLSP